ncbi:Potassium channel subfamily K member 12, partial [Halocaridina rubra]
MTLHTLFSQVILARSSCANTVGTRTHNLFCGSLVFYKLSTEARVERDTKSDREKRDGSSNLSEILFYFHEVAIGESEGQALYILASLWPLLKIIVVCPNSAIGDCEDGSALEEIVVETPPRNDLERVRSKLQISSDGLAELARAWQSGGGTGAVRLGDGLQPQPPGQLEGSVWTVDGWTAHDPIAKVTDQRPRVVNRNNSNTDSYSGSTTSGSSLEDTTTTSGSSFGCAKLWGWSDNSSGGECCSCCCMCPTPRGSAVKRPRGETVVMPPSGALPPLRRARFWNSFALKEDNARFFLLALVLLLYMVTGALIFQAFEERFELGERQRHRTAFNKSLQMIQGGIAHQNLTLQQVEQLLYIWGNMTGGGYFSGRRKWDFAGSFHFVYTVVSTI